MSAANPGQQPQQQENPEEAVLSFLRKRGYECTARTLERERAITTVERKSLQEAARHAASTPDSILLHKPMDPQAYIDQYGELREYVSDSLDMYKVELEQLLFPIFVHCFLEMVDQSHAEKAAEFFETYEHDHVFLYKKEVEALRGLRTPQHLEQSTQATMYRDHKFGLRMAQHTFHMLRSFLHEHNLVLLLSITNEHINIEVFAGDPEHSGLHDTMVVGLTGAELDGSPASQQQLNSKKIRWGALETPAVATHRRDQKEAALDTAREGMMPPPASKKPRVGEPALDTINMGDSQVPLPELSDAQWEAELVELKSSVRVSSSALPSVCCFTMFNAHNTMTSLDIARDGSRVAMGTSESVVYSWDLNRLAQTKQFDGKRLSHNDKAAKDRLLGPDVHVGHSGPVYASHFSPDSRFLLTASEDKTARMWSTETNSCLVAYKGHNYPVWDVKFAPLGVYFATGSHDRTARIWSSDHIHPLRILAGHLSDVDCVAWHPNCNYLATGSSDKTLRLWDIQTGQCVRLFTGHRGSLTCCAVSACGGYLASAGEDATVILWDLGSGRRVCSYQGHSSTVWSLDFAHESLVLASGSADGTCLLYTSPSPRDS
eukprot:TRINITY_DN54853_c0_g1_i1.p1 TRINITY_DN54853_c0_g1~~TRINITY_DN54853_c0_g1_i1.p1  ORF type:complete len:603 (-),score=137.22 TRINITY_DN54853_c0_g1_i1:140-1948(-)